MAVPKGRAVRPPRPKDDGEILPEHHRVTVFARTGVDVIERLESGAVALGISRAAYIELLVRRMPVNERGLPPWLADLDTGQRPLDLAS